MTDEKWDKLAMTNDDKVETGINIRDEANEEGTVMACIYRGGAVEVLDKGETWTEVKSGIVVGYIKNEYLTYGTEIKDMVDHYGIDGVEANWDDVHVFAQPDANAEIIHIANAGDVFPMLEDQGHWLTIKLDGKLFEDEVTEDGEVLKAEDRLAYVSIEDVTKVVLVDEAVPMEDYFGEGPYEETQEEYEVDSSYTQDSSGGSGSGNSSYTSTPAPSTDGSSVGSTSTTSNTSTTGTTTTTPAADSTNDNNSDDYEEDDGGDELPAFCHLLAKCFLHESEDAGKADEQEGDGCGSSTIEILRDGAICSGDISIERGRSHGREGSDDQAAEQPAE